jgi:hypothetical protein
MLLRGHSLSSIVALTTEVLPHTKTESAGPSRGNWGTEDGDTRNARYITILPATLRTSIKPGYFKREPEIPQYFMLMPLGTESAI